MKSLRYFSPCTLRSSRSVVQQVKVVLRVSQGNLPWICSALLASSHLQDQIKIWWVLASLWVGRNLFGLEIVLGEFSEIDNAIEDDTVFIVNADVIVNGVVADFFRFSEKNRNSLSREAKVFLQLSLLSSLEKEKFFEEEEVADGQSGWVVFNVFGKEEDSEILVVEGTVDDFEPHAIISFDIFAIRLGRVSDDWFFFRLFDVEIKSGEEFVGTDFSLDFFDGIDDEIDGNSY